MMSSNQIHSRRIFNHLRLNHAVGALYNTPCIGCIAMIAFPVQSSVAIECSCPWLSLFARHLCEILLPWRTTATAKSATEAWLKATWSTAFLALLSSPVASLAIATWAATPATSPITVVAAHHATWWGVRALGLDVCLRNDLGWKVEPFTKVVETFWGQGVVVPSVQC